MRSDAVYLSEATLAVINAANGAQRTPNSKSNRLKVITNAEVISM